MNKRPPAAPLPLDLANAYRTALETLRQHTGSGPARSPLSVLLRTAVTSRPAAKILVNAALRTRSERRAAIIAAAEAIAAAADERELP